MREQCLVCGNRLKNAARGRRRVYCSLSCRRKRERLLARLRRTQRRLEARRERYDIPGNGYGLSQFPYLLPRIEQARGELGAAMLKG